MSTSQAFSRKQSRVSVSVFFFIAGFVFSSWASRIAGIQSKLSLNEAELGTVLLALPIGLMISLLIAGGLITRLGSKKVLLTAATIYNGALISLGFANTTSMLVVCLFLFGLTSNLFNISVNTQAVGVEKLYGRPIMGAFHGIWSLAGFAGAAVGAGMLWLQITPVFHFLMSASFGWLFIFIFQNKLLKGLEKGKQPIFARPDSFIFKLGLIAFGCLMCEGTMFDWSSIYFKKVVGAPSQFISLGFAAFMGCMATGRFLADKIVMSIGSQKMLIYSGAMIFSGLMIAVALPSLIMATMGFMLVGFGVSSVVPIVYSKAGQYGKMQPGQALAAISTVGFAGFLAGPPLIGFIAEATSLRWSLGLVSLFGLGMALLAKKVL